MNTARQTYSVQEIAALPKQVIFDEVVIRLLEQGHCAMRGDSCMYDNGKGSRCAVGLLLNSDAIFQINFAAANYRGFPELAENMFETDLRGEQLDIITQLQNAHDYGAREASFYTEMSRRFREIAKAQALSTDVLFAQPGYRAHEGVIA